MWNWTLNAKDNSTLPPGPEKAFGEALREVRKAKGISQEKLALESGFDRTYVSLVERGVKSPTIRAVVRMAAVLGVPAVEIVGKMERLLDDEQISQMNLTSEV